MHSLEPEATKCRIRAAALLSEHFPFVIGAKSHATPASHKLAIGNRLFAMRSDGIIGLGEYHIVAWSYRAYVPAGCAVGLP